MIADAAKSKMARSIVLRRQTGMDFTGPLGLVAAKCFLAVFLSIFSVQRRQLAACSMPLSSQMLLRKLRVGDRERHGYLSDSDVRFGSIASL